MEILGIEIDERVALAAGAGLMACLILGTKPGQTMAMKIISDLTARPCTHPIVDIKKDKTVYCVMCKQSIPKLGKGKDLSNARRN